MHASLAFMNGAGARKEASTSIDATFFQILNLLCTSHRPEPLAIRSHRARAAERGKRPATFDPGSMSGDCAVQ